MDNKDDDMADIITLNADDGVEPNEINYDDDQGVMEEMIYTTEIFDDCTGHDDFITEISDDVSVEDRNNPIEVNFLDENSLGLVTIIPDDNTCSLISASSSSSSTICFPEDVNDNITLPSAESITAAANKVASLISNNKISQELQSTSQNIKQESQMQDVVVKKEVECVEEECPTSKMISTIDTSSTEATPSNLLNVDSSVIKSTAAISASKLVPITTASNKRPASTSINQASNLVTKVVVTQGKSNQAIAVSKPSIAQSSPICILPNTTTGSGAAIKNITVAQAQQIGLKLGALNTTSFRGPNTKMVLSGVPVSSGASGSPQVIHKMTQQIGATSSSQGSSIPAKILPAPPLITTKPMAVINSGSSANQTQKIYVRTADKLVTTQAATSLSFTSLANLTNEVTTSNCIAQNQMQFIKVVSSIGGTNIVSVPSSKSNFINVTSTSSFKSGNGMVMTTNKVPITPVTKVASSSSQVRQPIFPKVQRLILPATTISDSIVINSSQHSFRGDLLRRAGTSSSDPSNVNLMQPPPLIKIETGQLYDGNLEIDNNHHIVLSNELGPLKSPPLRPQSQVATAHSPTSHGLKSRKPCHCTRSQCLKLYCECFANGEFCNNCNCQSCHNNITHEENRQNAIKSCLGRNPQAFRPKIGKSMIGANDRRHTKGCHCKRSGCLKNYCECYEAQIPCSDNCKCVGCRNVDDSLFATTGNADIDGRDKTNHLFNEIQTSKNKLTAEIQDAVGQQRNRGVQRHAFSIIKDQVVDATCQCLIAQVDDAKRRNVTVEEGTKCILEEFGRCLIQIIECCSQQNSLS